VVLNEAACCFVSKGRSRAVWLGWQHVSCAFALLARFAGCVAEWGLQEVGRTAVYGPAGMIKGLVVEACRQFSLLAAQLFGAWRAHNHGMSGMHCGVQWLRSVLVRE
jgi:hypothetical protein